MKINILVPFVPNKPGGGLRVMFEYANRLSVLGHDIKIYFPVTSAFFEMSKIKRIVKFFYYKYVYGKIPRWFDLEGSVKTQVIYQINDAALRDADVIFSTWWGLCYDIKELSAAKGKHFNLVQDIENWDGFDDEVLQSYTVSKAENVVIAKYLYEYIGKVTSRFPHKVSFAIDNSRYKIQVPVSDRERHSVCMLYSLEPRKGSIYGLEAVNILKRRYPDLRVSMFGVLARPAGLPDWIEYFENYNDIPGLYNASAIFIGPSNQEGCALPPMEAMYCGCAVVCTDIDGHKDYAVDLETALLARPGDSQDIALKVQSLLDDDMLRLKIAETGNAFVNNFSWTRSTKELEEIFIKHKTAHH
jgi:glycosyltransferase involved in cell wall biosynthesis